MFAAIGWNAVVIDILVLLECKLRSIRQKFLMGRCKKRCTMPGLDRSAESLAEAARAATLEPKPGAAQILFCVIKQRGNSDIERGGVAIPRLPAIKK